MDNLLKQKIRNMKEVKYLEVDDTLLIISSIEKIIKEVLAVGKDIDKDYLENSISNVLNEFIYHLTSPSKSDLYLFKTIEKMIKTPTLISETFLKMNTQNIFNADTSSITYTSKLDNNFETAIIDSLNVLGTKYTESQKLKITNKDLSSSELVLFQNEIKKFLELFYNKKYDSIIKKGYSRRLVNIIEILDYIGTLQQNNTINNIKLKNTPLGFLGFDYEKNNSSTFKKPCIKDLMNSDFIKNFSIDELTAMCAFYSNRTAKGLRYYNYALFIFYKANIFEKYFEDPNYTFNLPTADIKKFIKQYKLLRITARNYLDSKSNSDKNEKFYVTNNTVEENPDNHFIKKFTNQFGVDYSPVFSEILPNYEHDYKNDLNKSIMFESGTYNIYKTKDQSLEALLFMLLEKNKEINWGVVVDDYAEGLPSRNKNNDLLICVDMKEFNMPLTLHCSRDQIRELIINYTGKPYIPVYKGNEDMFINKELFSTQIYMKLSKDQRKKLRELSENSNLRFSSYYKFIKHLQWMSHPKRPPEFVDNQNLVYDLNTGIIYYEKDLEKEQK